MSKNSVKTDIAKFRSVSVVERLCIFKELKFEIVKEPKHVIWLHLGTSYDFIFQSYSTFFKFMA